VVPTKPQNMVRVVLNRKIKNHKIPAVTVVVAVVPLVAEVALVVAVVAEAVVAAEAPRPRANKRRRKPRSITKATYTLSVQRI